MILFRHSDDSRKPDRACDEDRIAGHPQDKSAIELVRLPVGDTLSQFPISLGIAHDEEGALLDDVQVVLQPDRSSAANGERGQNNPKQRATVHRQIRRLVQSRSHTRSQRRRSPKNAESYGRLCKMVNTKGDWEASASWAAAPFFDRQTN